MQRIDLEIPDTLYEEIRRWQTAEDSARIREQEDRGLQQFLLRLIAVGLQESYGAQLDIPLSAD